MSAYEGVIEPLRDKNQSPHVDTSFVLCGPLPTCKKKVLEELEDDELVGSWIKERFPEQVQKMWRDRT
jgi:hypothetical protein